MMAICSIFLIMDGSEAAGVKKFEIWKYLYNHTDRNIYRRIRYLSVGGFANLKGKFGDKVSLGGYRLAQKIVKFN